MSKRREVHEIIKEYKDNSNIHQVLDSILLVFGINPTITLIQIWQENAEHKTGWSDTGWSYENGEPFDDMENYELDEILEEDKNGHVTKACFKYIG